MDPRKSEPLNDAADPHSPPLRNWLTLVLLFAVALSNYLDRSIITILQVPMKAELGLSDTQLGAMTGVAFAVCYTALGLPMSRLADRTSRKLVLTAAVTIWSIMTILCGFAGGFVFLFLARVGVAVGESAGAPVSHALVAQHFPLRRRALAMALWSLAIPGGAMLGLGLGGWMNEVIGWRHAFILVGLTGAILAPLVLLVRDRPVARAAVKAPAISWRDSFIILWRIKTFRYVCLAGMLHGFGLYAIYSWSAPFYTRVFGLSVGDAGMYLGLMSGIGGGIGILGAGVIANILGRRNSRWYMLVPSITATMLTPIALVQFLTGNLALSLLAGFFSSALTNAQTGPVVSTVQSLMPEPIRAFGSAVLVLLSGLAGLSLAPLLIGMMSDAMIAAGMPVDSLRYAIAMLVLFPALAGLTYFIASRHVAHELAEVRAREEGRPGDHPQLNAVAPGAS